MRLDHLRTRHSRRRGLTLIEVLGTLSVLLVLGLAAATVLGQVTEIGSRANRSAQGRAAIARMASTFREDVRQSQQINLNDTDSTLEIVSGEETIQYSWQEDPTVVVRKVTSGEKMDRLDRFGLPEECRPVCSLDENLVSWRLSDAAQPWIIEVKRP